MRKRKLDFVLYALVGVLCGMLLILADLTAEKVANALYPIPEIPKQEKKMPVPSIYEQISAITGGENVDVLYNLAKCESGLKIYAIGINHDKANSYDRGFYQINSYWHSEVPDHCAFDLKCATMWTNNMIKEGKLSEWVCSSKI